MSDLFRELAAEADELDMSRAPSEEGSTRLRKLGQELVDTESTIKRLESELSHVKDRKNQIAMRELVDLMSDVGQDRIGMPEVGEFGADLVLSPYVHANISSDWEPERRDAAFALLERKGDGDLVKNVLTMQFGRGDYDKVQALLRILSGEEFAELLRREMPEGSNDTELPPRQVEKTVPWNTLTAYVREQVASGTLHELWMAESDPVVDPLEVLGATVGHVVKIKPRKEN